MFEYTVEGCAEAIEYIKDTKQKHLLEHELSMDGWTIVALANRLKKKGYVTQ